MPATISKKKLLYAAAFVIISFALFQWIDADWRANPEKYDPNSVGLSSGTRNVSMTSGALPSGIKVEEQPYKLDFCNSWYHSKRDKNVSMDIKSCDSANRTLELTIKMRSDNLTLSGAEFKIKDKNGDIKFKKDKIDKKNLTMDIRVSFPDIGLNGYEISFGTATEALVYDDDGTYIHVASGSLYDFKIRKNMGGFYNCIFQGNELCSQYAGGQYFGVFSIHRDDYSEILGDYAGSCSVTKNTPLEVCVNCYSTTRPGGTFDYCFYAGQPMVFFNSTYTVTTWEQDHIYKPTPFTTQYYDGPEKTFYAAGDNSIHYTDLAGTNFYTFFGGSPVTWRLADIWVTDYVNTKMRLTSGATYDNIQAGLENSGSYHSFLDAGQVWQQFLYFPTNTSYVSTANLWNDRYIFTRLVTGLTVNQGSYHHSNNVSMTVNAATGTNPGCDVYYTSNATVWSGAPMFASCNQLWGTDIYIYNHSGNTALAAGDLWQHGQNVSGGWTWTHINDSFADTLGNTEALFLGNDVRFLITNVTLGGGGGNTTTVTISSPTNTTYTGMPVNLDFTVIGDDPFYVCTDYLDGTAFDAGTIANNTLNSTSRTVALGSHTFNVSCAGTASDWTAVSFSFISTITLDNETASYPANYSPTQPTVFTVGVNSTNAPIDKVMLRANLTGSYKDYEMTVTGSYNDSVSGACDGDFYFMTPCANGYDKNWGTKAGVLGDASTKTGNIYTNYSNLNSSYYFKYSFSGSGLGGGGSLNVSCWNYTNASWTPSLYYDSYTGSSSSIRYYTLSIPSDCRQTDEVVQFRQHLIGSSAEDTGTANFYEGMLSNNIYNRYQYSTVLPTGTYNRTIKVNNTEPRDIWSTPAVFTIGKASPGLSLSSSANWLMSEGNPTTITCGGVGGGLYKDHLGVANPYTFTPSAAIYRFDCNASTTTNYTAEALTDTLIVTTVVTGCTNFYMFAHAVNITATDYPYSVDLTDYYNQSLFKYDMTDVYVDPVIATMTNNYTGGMWLTVTNLTPISQFTVQFGNYIGNDVKSNGAVSVNNVTAPAHTDINPYYNIAFYNEMSRLNVLPPNSTKIMLVYCTSGTSIFDIQNTTQNMTLATNARPQSIRLTVTYSLGDFYYRDYIVRADQENKTIWVVDATQYQILQNIFMVDDRTGSFNIGSVFKIKEYMSNDIATITEQKLDIERKAITYLISGNRYQIFVDNGVEERSIGEVYADATRLTKNLVIQGINTINTDAGWVNYSLVMSNYTFQFSIADPSSKMNLVEFWVVNGTNTSQQLYYTSSANRSSVSFTYAVPDPNILYLTRWHMQHDIFGNYSLGGQDWWRPNKTFGVTMPLYSVVTALGGNVFFFLLLFMAPMGLLLPQRYVGIGAFLMTLTAAILAYWEIYDPLAWGAIAVAFVFVVLMEVGERRKWHE